MQTIDVLNSIGYGLSEHLRYNMKMPEEADLSTSLNCSSFSAAVVVNVPEAVKYVND